MQVRHILHDKGRDVVAIGSNATLCDAAKLLTEMKIGALVVVDTSGRLIGIISERDLVQAMAKEGAAAFSDQVGNHMTTGAENLCRNRHGGNGHGSDDPRPVPPCAGAGRSSRPLRHDLHRRCGQDADRRNGERGGGVARLYLRHRLKRQSSIAFESTDRNRAKAHAFLGRMSIGGPRHEDNLFWPLRAASLFPRF